MPAGSMTTTQSNDVIISWGTPGGWGTPYIGTAPTAFRAMSGFRLLSADNWIGFVAQIGVKASAGAINPTIYMLSPTAESFNTLAVALKTDNTKGSQATGIRVVGLQKMRMNNGTYVKAFFPTWGNLQVLASSETPSQCSVDAVRDSSNGGTAWTRLNDAGAPQMAYIGNSVSSSSNIVYVSNTTNFLHSVLYDIAGAHTSPYDTTQIASGGTINGPAYVPNAPDITPSTAEGLMVASLNFYVGPPDGCDLPTGVVFDCAYHTGMTDLSTMDTGDGYAHYNYATAAAQSWRWHETAVTTTAWFTRAAAFKAAATSSNTNYSPAVGSGSLSGVAALLNPQFGTVISDQSSGGWTPSTGDDLFECINESARSDSDYIQSAGNPSNDACIIQLSTLADPGVDTGFHLQWAVGAVNATGTVVGSLRQGNSPGTEIAAWTHSNLPVGSYQEFDDPVTSAQAANITDFSDLYLKFVAS